MENRVRYDHLVQQPERVGAVVMTSRATSLINHDDPALTAAASEAWAEGARATVAGLNAAGIPVLVMLDVPRFERRVPECTIRRSDCDADRSDVEAFRSPAADAEISAVSSLPLAAAWDPFDVLCDEARCRATDGGVVLYRDTDHLSEAGAKFLEPALTLELEDFLTEVGARGDG